MPLPEEFWEDSPPPVPTPVAWEAWERPDRTIQVAQVAPIRSIGAGGQVVELVPGRTEATMTVTNVTVYPENLQAALEAAQVEKQDGR
jgi:hypothetical protein